MSPKLRRLGRASAEDFSSKLRGYESYGAFSNFEKKIKSYEGYAELLLWIFPNVSKVTKVTVPFQICQN